MAKDTRDRKRRNHHLENIETECKHILHLLNNLLDVYRPERVQGNLQQCTVQP
ncbi:hypothetical protein NIB75_14215 [Bacteroides uniformis]|nr:hypothetical protein [Bacteroides uniformis]